MEPTISTGEEVAHALIDVDVNTTVRRAARPIAEVVRPAEQEFVQRVPNVRPRIDVARHQEIADFRLCPLHTLLGRARAQVPLSVPRIVVWPERVAQEVEAFLP